MSKPNVTQIAETGGAFQTMANDHGGMFVIGGEQGELRSATLRYLEPDPANPNHKFLTELTAQEAGVVPVGPNFDELTRSHGREFGLLVPNQGIHPAVVTPRSRPGGAQGKGDAGLLHMAYLTNYWDKIDPGDIAKGAGDPLNALLLQTSNTLYGPTIAAHGRGGRVLPGELGHRYGGLRALSDPNVAAAALQKIDVADSLAASGKGLAANITSHGKNIAGAFDVIDERGQVRRIQYATASLGPNSRAMLIDHRNFNSDVREQIGGMEPAVAATGLAIVAKMSREQPVDRRRALATYSQQALGLR